MKEQSGVSRQSYSEIASSFAWNIPERLNLGAWLSDRRAALHPCAAAILDLGETPAETPAITTFGALAQASSRLASALSARGVRGIAAPDAERDGSHGPIGDRVAVLLPQRAETAIAHLGAWKLGATSLPLFTLFGPDALRHRLRDSGARALITDADGLAKIEKLRGDLPDLRVALSVDGAAAGAEDFWTALAGGAADFPVADTHADDPALLIYTSGTTGPPKGALHAHRVLHGHLPGVEMSHDFSLEPGAVMWTPADWAWIGGLLDVMGPALAHGAPLIAHRPAKFDPEAAAALIRRHEVKLSFLPPTALKMMRRAPGSETWSLGMTSVASGGESLGGELLDWGRGAFGVTINEFYGQTECNMVVSSAARHGASESGAMGWPAPGHRTSVIDEAGRPCAADVEGDIAVAEHTPCGRPDPVMFLRYWRNSTATDAKFRTDAATGARWLLTGDRGVRRASGAIVYKGRDDDIINSAGYRIGPGEVEDCLLAHPAVRMAGVVGQPDALRGEAVAAYVTLAEGVTPSAALAGEIAGFVKRRLAAHEYPRAVRFLDALPMTATGKILRRELRARAERDVAADAREPAQEETGPAETEPREAAPGETTQ